MTGLRASRGVKFTLALLGTLLCLRTFPVAQSGGLSSDFGTRCGNCWPGWTAVSTPTNGVGPSARNRRGLVFINGFDPEPSVNQQHLVFNQVADSVFGVNQFTAWFNFNNAAVGGKLNYTDGRFDCLSEGGVMTYVANELLIWTLRDGTSSWYGAFIGDIGLLDSEFVPEPDTASPNAYSTIGLLRRVGSETDLLAVKVIPTLKRFTPISVRITIDETPGTETTLRMDVGLTNNTSYDITSEMDPTVVPNTGRVGLIYLVGNATPCTNFPQREIAVEKIEISSNPALR